ncbi:hypothetical protein J2X76_006080 [Neorhizobium sp. 2083]|nr:hypothetical protein [Neorhizobium sp. 2083]
MNIADVTFAPDVGRVIVPAGNVTEFKAEHCAAGSPACADAGDVEAYKTLTANAIGESVLE